MENANKRQRKEEKQGPYTSNWNGQANSICLALSSIRAWGYEVPNVSWKTLRVLAHPARPTKAGAIYGPYKALIERGQDYL